MGKTKPENCLHPWKSRERISYGRYKCGKCDTDLTPPERRFEIRHSERVLLTHGDRIAVSRDHESGSFQGLFLWAEECSKGVYYHVVELQRWTHEGRLREDWAQHRWVHPDHVRQAPGVRDRKQREEHNGKAA